MLVIATNVGGVPEQIIDNETGWVVPYEGYVEMAEKIIELSTQRERLKNVGLNAHRLIQEKYTTNHMINNYLDFYKEICEDFRRK